MASESQGALLASTSATATALNQMNTHIGVVLGFAVLLLFVSARSEGGGSLLLVALLMGVPLCYLIYRAIRALGKELRLYEGGVGRVSNGNELFFSWNEIRSITGAVPVRDGDREGYLGGNLVITLNTGDSFYADEHFEHLDKFVKLLCAQAANHLVPPMIDRLHQGEIVDLRSLRATPAGLEVAGQLIPWANVQHISYDTSLDHSVRVHADSGMHAMTIASTYNAALLPTIVKEMQTSPAPAEVVARFQMEPAGGAVSTGTEEFPMNRYTSMIALGGTGFFLLAALGFVVLARYGPKPPPAAVEVVILGVLVVMAGGFLIMQWRLGDLRFVASPEGLKRISRDTETFVPWDQVVDVQVSGGENKTYVVTTSSQGVWKFYGGMIGLDGHGRLFNRIKAQISAQ